MHMIVTRIYVWFRQIDGIAPTFAKKPAIRQEEDGKRLLFECRIQADPVPAVSWFHNTTPVKDSPRHKVTDLLIIINNILRCLHLTTIKITGSGQIPINKQPVT